MAMAMVMEMEERLCCAAFEGDTETLEQLLVEDPSILDKAVLKCSDYKKTPLHVAAMLGHANFARVIMEVSSDMCLARDGDGRNPLHLAAIKGKGEVLDVLINGGAGRSSYLAVLEKTEGGGTVLHLCVKYNQLEMLKILVRAVHQDSEFLNAKNDEGMSVLHLAALDLQIETIRYLVENHIDINARDGNGRTALDISLTRGGGGETNYPSEIQRILQDSGALRSQDLANNNNGHTVHISASDWLNKKRDAIMIVATLIATFAFQAGLNPAGGVWQDDSLSSKISVSGSGSDSAAAPPQPLHRAGEAIMAHYHPKFYKNFVRANTVAFVSSLSTILLLISGLPFRRRFFMWCLMVIMWLTITSVAMTYGISIMMVTPKHYQKTLSHVIETAVTVWCFVMSLLLLGNTIRLVKRWIKSGGIKRFRARSGGLLASRDYHDQKKQQEGQGFQIQKNGITVRID